jgi:hypothetical protein
VKGKEILVVAGDRGGWNAIEPPLLRALGEGCDVYAYFAATCGKQFADGKLRPDERMKVWTGSSELGKMGDFFSDHICPDLVVVGASQSKDGTEATLRALEFSQSMPRLGMQDMYGSIAPTLRMVHDHGAFDCLCVTDEFSRDMVLKEFPRLRDRVVITGGPQFDKTIEVKKNWQEERRRMRQLMQVADSDPVFLVVGGMNGTAEMLEVLDDGIDQAGFAGSAKVILRAHPRATEKDRRLVNEYMDSTLIPKSSNERKWFVDVDRTIAPTSEDLLSCADFVLTGYSTTGYFGILYGMPGVVYVGTPAFQRDLWAEKGLRRPPEVEAGAGWYVQNGDDMSRIITAVRHEIRVANLLKMEEAQKKISSFNDGHATDRVWQEMQKLMTR